MLWATASQFVTCALAQNVGAYVVGDHYTAPWEFPATKKHLDQGASYLEALLAVLKEEGERQSMGR